MSAVLGVSAALAFPASCLAYLVWLGVRLCVDDPLAEAYARQSVKFHGVWGMVLSLPLVVLGVATVRSPGAEWLGLLMLAATFACWALAIAAMRGSTFPAVLRWWPLTVTLVTFIILPASMSDTWQGYLLYAAIVSLFGFGLAAWVLVSVNFARWVGRAQRTSSAIANCPVGFQPIFPVVSR